MPEEMIATLLEESARLQAENAELQAEEAELQAEVAALTQQAEELLATMERKRARPEFVKPNRRKSGEVRGPRKQRAAKHKTSRRS